MDEVLRRMAQGTGAFNISCDHLNFSQKFTQLIDDHHCPLAVICNSVCKEGAHKFIHLFNETV